MSDGIDWKDREPANDAHEQWRLDALRSYDILDTAPEIAFDRIVDLARVLFNTPVALITFVDRERQWFKARAGLDLTETSREQAFCDHAVRQPGVMVVPDARLDARFAANPLVTGNPNIRFYAGAPLVTQAGARLGTVCVISPQPRPGLSVLDAQRLESLAAIASNELELRLQTARARSLAQQNALLVREIDHRVRSSLRLVSSVLEAQARRTAAPPIRQALYEVLDRIASVEILHQHLQQGDAVFDQDVRGYLLALTGNLQEIGIDLEDGRSISLSVAPDLRLPTERLTRLGMVVAELVANALRHGDGAVEIQIAGDDDAVTVSVSDDGPCHAGSHQPPLAHDPLGLQLLSMLAAPGGITTDPSSPRRIVVRLSAAP